MLTIFQFVVTEGHLRFRQLAICQGEVRVALNSFFEQFHFLVRDFFALPIRHEIQFLGLCIVGVGNQIGGRSFRNHRFFRRRKLGAELIGDSLRDFALDGKDVGKVAIVMLSPKMRIVARVD